MHIHLPYLIFPWSFNEIRLVVSENSRGHEQYPIYLCRTHQRAITLGKIIEPEHAGDMRIHLWYLIFPWSFTEIRQAVSENLRGQERDGRTDARTHGRTDARTHGRTDARTKRRLYAPPKFFGEHKNCVGPYTFYQKEFEDCQIGCHYTAKDDICAKPWSYHVITVCSELCLKAGLWKYHARLVKLVPFPWGQLRNFNLLVLGQGLHSSR